MEDSLASGLGGLTSLSDSEAPDSTMLAARDKTSRGDSGSGMSSVVAITITTCTETLLVGAGNILKLGIRTTETEIIIKL